jgi:lipoyl-dependent peroxiredoxin
VAWFGALRCGNGRSFHHQEEDAMATDRRAEVTWRGGLTDGSGTIERVGSGVFGSLPVSWAARTEEPGGKTSPEELIAAAHASCFAMALSNVLAKAGSPPDELRTSATVTFQPGEGITRSALTVEARVPGIDAEAFRAAAEEGKENCPVSQALAGGPEITLDARLDE